MWVLLVGKLQGSEAVPITQDTCHSGIYVWKEKITPCGVILEGACFVYSSFLK